MLARLSLATSRKHGHVTQEVQTETGSRTYWICQELRQGKALQKEKEEKKCY